MLIIWRFQGAACVVKTCDLQTAWKTFKYVRKVQFVCDWWIFDLFCWTPSLKVVFFSMLTEICAPNPVQQLFFLFQFGMLTNERGHLSIYALQWLMNGRDLGWNVVFVLVCNLFLCWVCCFVRHVEVSREVWGVWRGVELRRLTGVSL